MPGKGQDIVEIALEHVGERYVFGARVPLANARWEGPWDCAEFASWCVYHAAGVLYGVEPETDPLLADAYTGYWAQQSRRDEAQIDVAVAVGVAGSLLLRIPGAHGGGGHIAISDGKSGTIEAHSSKDGVIRGKAGGRRWDCGVLVPGVLTFAAVDPPQVKLQARTLRLTTPLTSGALVRTLQRALAAADLPVGRVDGVYGPQTVHAIQQYQIAHHLVADGEVGPTTLKALKIPVPAWMKA